MDIEIILVDDDHVSLLITKRTLISSSCSVDFTDIVSFSDPQQAINYLNAFFYNSNRIYFIILDINMPIISGWDFLNLLNEINFNKKIHVIMLTSSISQEDKIRAFANPLVVELINKPLDSSKCKIIEDLIVEYIDK